jgi:trans-AT polyketide synthase, acyltransferase and oxidoreductase domains
MNGDGPRGAPTAWLFPGQGSQRKGMGRDQFDRFPDLCDTADRVLGFSIRELCLDDPDDRLRLTRYAQPALFFVTALAYLAKVESAPAPAFLAGHSLGEYNALLAAGCFDLETGLRLVRRRGEVMGRADGGGMTAVVGLGWDRVTALMRRAGVADVDVANDNGPSQVVLSGSAVALQAAEEAIRADGVGRCVPLNVSAPFHSRHMETAAAEFADFLEGFTLADPRVPVISNVTGQPYGPGAARTLLAEQVRRPVRWWDSMRYLLRQGVEEVEEVGPGHVLTGLWRTARDSRDSPDSRDSRPEPAGGTAPGPAAPLNGSTIRPESLGSAEFRADYGVRYAYVAGSMFKGIASAALVVRMARAGLMGFFGTGGLSLGEIEDAIREIEAALPAGASYGMNLLYPLDNPGLEEATVALYLKRDVRFVEAAAYLQVTAPLVRFRFSGAHRRGDGRPVAVRRVLAKVSRPEVATAFMQPPPAPILERLVREGGLTTDEAEAARMLPISEDVCVEADSGGHTDGRVAYALIPSMTRLRDEVMARHGYPTRIRIGTAGGIGTPEAVAAALVLGAEFIVTGSINQCTPEAGTSAPVKDMLADLDVQDTAYAPAGDMFELGARAQVVRRGTLFPARANKLYQVYRQYASLEQIDEQTRRTIEGYFKRSFDDVWRETRDHLVSARPAELEKAERDPRTRLALVFKWYFVHTTRLAIRGVPGEKANYQVHCGPAMGALNRFLDGTDLEDWRGRHVDVLGERLMHGAAALLSRRLPGRCGAAAAGSL